MKPIIALATISSIFLVSSSLYAQNPTFEWAKQMGGTGADQGQSVTTDAMGNVYTTGYFTGTVDFDPGIGTTNLTSLGNTDIFIQKLDAAGNLLWVKQMGGTGIDQGFSIAIDAVGSVYTTGNFQGTVDFNPGGGTTNLTSNGDADIYIQKLDAVGNLLWVKQMGGANYDEGRSIITDGMGNVYTTGAFFGTVDFDPGLGTVNLTSNGDYDIFIQKLDAAGNFLWINQMGGMSEDAGLSITTDVIGNIYTTGYFTGTVDFDPGVGITNLTSNGMDDIFIQKLSAAGNLLWVKQMGGTSIDFGYSITTDALGNVYTTGYFWGIVDFDPGVGITNLTSLGNTDIFIQKLDAAGNFLWVKQMGGVDYDRSHAITTDANNNVYTVGYFKGTVDFDPGVGISNLTSNGDYDVFVQKLDASGSFMWVKQIGGLGEDNAYSITIDNMGSIYTTGSFNGTVDFDPGVGVTNMISNGNRDIFIQKMGQCQTTFATDTQTACANYQWIDGITYISSNNTATHTLTNASGCDSVVTLDLTIIIVNITTTQTNGTNLSANATGALYQWIDCDNNNSLITGATNQNYIATANGNYAVIVTENGCTDTSACIVVNNVGLKDNADISEINIFPNPTKDEVFIHLGNRLYGQYTIELLDVTGRLLSSQLMNDNLTAVSLTNYEMGVYIIRILNVTNQSVHRVIKQ